MTILQLIGLLIVIGIILWGIGQFPIDAAIMRLIKVLVIVVVALWVLAALGLLPDAPLPRLHRW